MGTNRDDWISDRAYQIWDEEGRQAGRHEDHWRRAEAELDAREQKLRPLEVWVSKAQPQTRLVIPQGGDLPAELGVRDWKQFGPFKGGIEIAQEVKAKGFAFFETDEALPDPASLRNDNASGA